MSARVESANGTGAALYQNQQKKESATLVCGGNRYTEGGCAKSFFVHQTMFDNCAPGMTVALANDTTYGLANAVFTSDGTRALRVIKEIRASACQVTYMSYEEVSKEIERIYRLY